MKDFEHVCGLIDKTALGPPPSSPNLHSLWLPLGGELPSGYLEKADT